MRRLLIRSLIALVGSTGMVHAAPFSVVIDPGHGGSNTGAAARVAGRYEKQVTLAIARELKARLEREGVRVLLTRDRDEYLTLRERARRGNAAHADCFLSLHANASPDHGRRGVETWVLDPKLIDVEARRAAERARAANASGVDAMLAELQVLDWHRVSIVLARALQARLVRAATDGARAPNDATPVTSDRGVREAVYDVLAGVDAPAVLVEIGFIDHPVEGARLLDPDGQKRIADALTEGLFDFFARPRYAAR